jgi:hypothetical protein
VSCPASVPPSGPSPSLGHRTPFAPTTARDLAAEATSGAFGPQTIVIIVGQQALPYSQDQREEKSYLKSYMISNAMFRTRWLA